MTEHCMQRGHENCLFREVCGDGDPTVESEWPQPSSEPTLSHHSHVCLICSAGINVRLWESGSDSLEWALNPGHFPLPVNVLTSSFKTDSPLYVKHRALGSDYLWVLLIVLWWEHWKIPCCSVSISTRELSACEVTCDREASIGPRCRAMENPFQQQQLGRPQLHRQQS